MAFGKNASGKVPMSKTGSKSPAPMPGKAIAFGIQNTQAKYGKTIKKGK